MENITQESYNKIMESMINKGTDYKRAKLWISTQFNIVSSEQFKKEQLDLMKKDQEMKK